MIPFPDLSPEIISIDLFGVSFALRWYAVSYIMGFICAIRLMKFFIVREHLWRLSSPPMNSVQADALLTYLILGVILGGRIGYVLFYNPEYYASNILDIVRIWDGGMAFHGGFIGVIVAVLIYCRVNLINLWSSADLIAVASPPGLLFGRLANFINAELWGKPTQKPWGVVFPSERAQNCGPFVSPCGRHPSQLYEAALEGFILLLLLFLLARSGGLRWPGLMTGVFSLWYGMSRFLVEYFRVPDPQFFSASNLNGFAYKYGDYGVTMGQVLSLPMIIIGLFLIASAVRSRALTRK